VRYRLALVCHLAREREREREKERESSVNNMPRVNLGYLTFESKHLT